ncbi:MAG: PorV/PorQ family protein [Balneolaceae bacterium]
MMNKAFPFLFLLFSFPVAAQDTGSGLDFLNISPSARMLSISEAGTASLTGPAAIYSNPSLLVFEPSSALDVNYTLWVSDVENQFAAVNLLKDSRALAFGVYNSRATDFEARDRPGPSQGSFSISYLSLSAAGAYRLGPVAAGITAHYLREEIFELRANGYAITAGASTEFMNGRIRAGASLKNLGEMEELDTEATKLPAELNLGVMANLVEFTTPGANDLPVLLSLHTNWLKPIEENSSSDYTGRSNENFFTVALSANASDLLFLQAGYIFGPTERPFSTGMGLRIEPVRVNYALVPFSTGFGTVHSIGIQFYF